MVDLIKDKNMVIPLYLYRLREKLGLSLEEFILIIYFYNQGDLILFDVTKISSDLGLNSGVLMSLIDSITKKSLIELKVVKNDKNIMEEYVSLDNFYNKVSLLLMDTKEDDDHSNIFSMIEQEFGRTLSPIEYEIVKAWLEHNMSVELIECALKEATMNGVSNLRYIDKILYEWGKKGIKNKQDVEKYTEKYRKREEKDNKKVDVFDYDWLDEDDS